jgi:hypothetical protein
MTAANGVILTVRVMPARKNGASGDITRFVRYVQYRDVHPDSALAEDVDGLVAYVHHRDPTSPRGRMFDATGPAGDDQRTALVDHVTRSNEELLGRHKPSATSLRSAYRLIISPEDARGLNLQRLARAAMARLEADSGGPLPPWIAGEHHNTKHPHVHIVLAARRESSPGRFRTVLITRERLAAMKETLQQELELQRGAHIRMRGSALRAGEAESQSRLQTNDVPSIPAPTRVAESRTPTSEFLAWTGRRRPRGGAFAPGLELAAMAGRLSRYHQREAERLARRRMHGADEEEEHGRGRGLHR